MLDHFLEGDDVAKDCVAYASMQDKTKIKLN